MRDCSYLPYLLPLSLSVDLRGLGDLVFVSEPVLIELRLLLHKDVKLLLQDLVCCDSLIYLGQPVSLSFEPVVGCIPYLGDFLTY